VKGEENMLMVMNEVRNYFNKKNTPKPPHRPPADFVTLCAEIEEYNEGSGKPTAYTSETVVGLHSWSVGANAGKTAWQEVFRARLNPYRRMFAGKKHG
jgi:hypothetical protein